MDGYSQQNAALTPAGGGWGWLDLFAHRGGAGKKPGTEAGAGVGPKEDVARGLAPDKGGDSSAKSGQGLAGWGWPGADRKGGGSRLGEIAKAGFDGQIRDVAGVAAEGKAVGGPTNEVGGSQGAMVDVASPVAENRDEEGAPPELPANFSVETVLRAWIAEFNKSLLKQRKPGAAQRKTAKALRDLKELGWADDGGLSYDRLAEAASKEPPLTPAGPKAYPQSKQPDSMRNIAIVKMMASKKGTPLNKVIELDYVGKCLQFSEQMMRGMGAKRADGSGARDEKKGDRAKVGAATAKYRSWRIEELGDALPAGYQICVTSKPEWGFTEVGNHWFVSAGGGLYLDNAMGVVDAAGLTRSLKDTTAKQWASRVLEDPALGGGYSTIRGKVAELFIAANPQFRSDKDLRPSPTYTPDPAKIDAARSEIVAFVKSKPEYLPKVWLVEPTSKVESSGSK
jgi:hypothetical protein